MRLTLAALTLLALLVPVSAQDEEHPIAQMVKSKLKDPAKPFTMGIRVKVKEGMGPKLEAAFAEGRKLTLKEKGCQAYDLNKSTEDETQYVIYERWASLADLKEHLKAPHVTKLLGAVHEYFDGQPEVKVFVPVGE